MRTYKRRTFIDHTLSFSFFLSNSTHIMSIISQKNMICLDKKFDKSVKELLTSAEKASTKAKPKIQRVPLILRGQNDSDFKMYYEPRWMSIGLIHHGNPKFELAEKYKIKLAAKFILDGGHKIWKDFYDTIKVELRNLKNCFDMEIVDKYYGEGDTDDFSFILFFDGCAVLQFIHSFCSKGHELKDMSIKNDLIAFTMHDLFLLENQIPYQVLELLIGTRSELKGSIGTRSELKGSIVKFITRNIMAPEKYQEDIKAGLLDPEPAHLLDLFLSALVRKPGKQSPTVEGTDPQQNSSTTTNPAPHIRKAGEENPTVKGKEPTQNTDNANNQPDVENQASNDQNKEPKDKSKQRCSFIDQAWTWISKTSVRYTLKASWICRDKGKKQQSFRSITDLKASGIYLKPSQTSSLGDVHFSSFGFAGELKLPPLLVDDSTGSKFMNLVAYEMCPDNTKTEYEVTSYLGFLDSLIDYPTDVNALRTARILHNFLGSDQEVADLFNKIATDLVPNQEVYKSVIEGIEKHYTSKWRTWMAQVCHDHFSSPWTIVTFIAALLAIGMSAIQTWFTVYSVEGPCDNFCHHLKKL